MQNEARNPQIVGHFDAHARSHLELPLGGHHLCVGAANLHARIQTRAVMRLHHLAAVHLVGAHAAVVRSLWSGETMLGPAQWTTVDVEQRVLLLDAEPRHLGGHGVGDLLARLPMIGLGRCAIEQERFAEHKDVVAAAERILVDRDGMQVDVRVGAGRLAGRAAVIVPDGQFCGRCFILIGFSKIPIGQDNYITYRSRSWG